MFNVGSKHYIAQSCAPVQAVPTLKQFKTSSVLVETGEKTDAQRFD
jgi:hypothetical protein